MIKSTFKVWGGVGIVGICLSFLGWFFAPGPLPTLKAPESPYREPPLDSEKFDFQAYETILASDKKESGFEAPSSHPTLRPFHPLDLPDSLGPPPSLILLTPSDPYTYPLYHQR